MFDDVLIFGKDDCFSLFYDEPTATKNGLVQTVKLFDGFFLGNVHAGRESQFISNNKIGLIVNCHPLELDIQESSQTKVLSYNFHTKRGCVQDSVNTSKICEIVREIEKVLNEQQEGVILVSKNIDSRVFCFAGVYLMIKYGWNTQKYESFLQKRKTEIDIAEKYKNILNNFERCHQKDKFQTYFSGKQSKQHEKLIENTLKNSEAHFFPDFNGLSHKRHEIHPKEGPQNKRSIKFLDEVQYIAGAPTNIQKNWLQQQLPEQVQVIPLPMKKITFKTSSAEQKLKSFIREKCHPNQISDLFNKKVLELPKQQKQIKVRDIDIVPRRRAISKTEQSFDFDLDEEKKIKTNLFLEESILSKNIGGDNSQKNKKNSLIADFLSRARPKVSSACSSKTQIPKRCNTEATNHTESQKESQIKINSLFKISKNKTSHKKIHADQAHRAKTHSIKSSEKHFRHFQVQLEGSSSGRGMEEVINSSLDPKKESEIKSNMVNFNVNIHIDNLNLIQGRREGSESVEDDRKQSAKVKKRTLPKRLIRQTILS